MQVVGVDAHRCQILFDELEGHFAEDLLDVLLQISHATLAAIELDELAERLVADRNLFGLHARLLDRCQIRRKF